MCIQPEPERLLCFAVIFVFEWLRKAMKEFYDVSVSSLFFIILHFNYSLSAQMESYVLVFLILNGF